MVGHVVKRKKSHLNSRTFSRFSSFSIFVAGALFSLTSKDLVSSLWSLSALFILIAGKNFFSVSSVITLSSSAVNLCFVCRCSKNKKVLHNTRNTTTTAYKTHRRASERRKFVFFSFLSSSMANAENFNRDSAARLLAACLFTQAKEKASEARAKHAGVKSSVLR